MVEKKNSYDHKDIYKILPHRFPFLLVDKVVSITRSGEANGVGDEIHAQKNVTFNEPFFTGHFPDMPIMPGVLIIEALAQAAGLCVHKPHPKGEKWNYFMLGVDNARFRKPVFPGEVLDLKCKLVKIRSNFFSFHCKAYANGELKAEADILAQMGL
jgi:3-hydroxyacyl-[acyl-carrier-protein] dehydratase